MSELLQVMTLPFLVCLMLAGMYAYLGFHVIERQVIFVDLALAQIAILGASVATLWGQDHDSPWAYIFSLGFVVLAAAIFSLTRFKDQRIPQEAIIGITYAVSAAVLVMVLSRSAQGDEHIKQALVGNILLVNKLDLLRIALMCLGVALMHLVFRKPFFLISRDPQQAFQEGFNVRGWDFLFYISFGLVVTSSVKMAGVLLVFSFLVVPAVSALLFFQKPGPRLLFGWGIGFVASAFGMAMSYYFDFPTGASVVCVFGALLIFMSVIKKLFSSF